MSEKSVSLINIPDGLVKPVEEGVTPIAKSFGESAGGTISTAWELVFGGLNTKLEKVRYKRQKDVQSFKDELDKKISEVPKENLVEAKMHIVGPVLEASKYYFEEEDIRNMFSSLIASSVDNSINSIVHPCFVDIIKQISSYDANILKLFDNNKSFPIVKYKAIVDGGNKFNFFASNVFLGNSKLEDFSWEILDKNSSSLTNLDRLGLISLTYNSSISSFNYEIFKDTEPFKEMELYRSNNNLKVPSNSYSNYEALEYEPGVAFLTQLGKDFLKVCCE